MTKSRNTARDIALCGLFVALIIVGAFIKIPSPLVPFTMQYVFVLLAGFILGPVKGPVCVLIYIALGLIGIPVFTAGGGISYVAKPTFGFLVGFIFTAFLAGYLTRFLMKKNKLNLVYAVIVAIIALFACYIIGVPYMYLIIKYVLHGNMSFGKACMSGCVMFLPTDFMWAVLGSILYLKIIPMISKYVKTRNPKQERLNRIKREVISGKDITKEDAMFLLSVDTNSLSKAAYEIQKKLHKEDFEFCSIINAKSGKCSEDCKFCAQSCHYNTDVETYPLMDEKAIMENAKLIKDAGIKRFSIVTAGKNLTHAEVCKLCEITKKVIATYGLKVCVSIGLIADEDFALLKESGIDRIHNNLETSQKHFPNICSTHTYEQKVAMIKKAKESGLTLCSGGIFGVNETPEDRVEMAFALKELGAKSVPINILCPIKNTPFENNQVLTSDDARRIVAIFRFILPDAYIRLAGGRRLLEDNGYSCFKSGSNATISGDLLTTQGIKISDDIQKIESMGYKVNEKN